MGKILSHRRGLILDTHAPQHFLNAATISPTSPSFFWWWLTVLRPPVARLLGSAFVGH